MGFEVVLLVILFIIIFFIFVITGSDIAIGKAPTRMDKTEWYFLKGDQDINPSWPHLHDKNDKKRKMDIYTGNIYIKNKIVRSASKKEFVELWSDEKFLTEVKEIRKLYPFGEGKLPPIPHID